MKTFGEALHDYRPLCGTGVLYDRDLAEEVGYIMHSATIKTVEVSRFIRQYTLNEHQQRIASAFYFEKVYTAVQWKAANYMIDQQRSMIAQHDGNTFYYMPARWYTSLSMYTSQVGAMEPKDLSCVFNEIFASRKAEPAPGHARKNMFWHRAPTR